MLEGAWPGDVIALRFPDRVSATDWYVSDAYRKILPLRLNNAKGDIFMIDGVSEDHRATDIL